MNKKFKTYCFFIVFFVFFSSLACGQEIDSQIGTTVQTNNKSQKQTTEVVEAKNQPKLKTKKELAKLALKNGIFAVIGEYYKIDQELLMVPRLLFMILFSYATNPNATNTTDHSYPIKTFIAANLLASGVNGLIMSAGAVITAVPFNRCIMFLTEKSGFFSNGLNSLLLKKWSLFFNDNGSYQFKYFLEFFKDKNSYSVKYFLLKLTRGVVYTGQLLVQSIVGSVLGQYFTFK